MLGVVLVTYVAVLVMLGTLRAWSLGVPFNTGFLDTQHDLVSASGAQLVAMGAALALGLRLHDPERPLREAVHAAAVRPATLALCFVAGLGLQFPFNELSNILHSHVFGPLPMEAQLRLQDMVQPDTAFGGVVAVVALVGVAPLMEELLFRGHMAFGLQRRYGTTVALLISSILFGVAHMDPTAAAYASVAGLLLGQLALSTTSVWPGVALHAGINAMPVLLPQRLWALPGFNVPSETPQHLAWPFVIGGLLWGTAALLLALRIGYVREQS